jgi:hypothetical protein
MARKTNYKFEKFERERRKSEKKAAKAEAKKAVTDARKGLTESDDAEERPDGDVEGGGTETSA